MHHGVVLLMGMALLAQTTNAGASEPVDMGSALALAPGAGFSAQRDMSVTQPPVPRLEMSAMTGFQGLGGYAPALAFAPPPGLYSADGSSEEPSSGLGQIIPGWILTGLGAVNLATMPLCFTDYYVDGGVKDLCVGLTAGFATVMVGIGVPLLIVGYSKRSKHKAWEAQQGGATRSLSFAGLPGGGQALYRLEF